MYLIEPTPLILMEGLPPGLPELVITLTPATLPASPCTGFYFEVAFPVSSCPFTELMAVVMFAFLAVPVSHYYYFAQTAVRGLKPNMNCCSTVHGQLPCDESDKEKTSTAFSDTVISYCPLLSVRTVVEAP